MTGPSLGILKVPRGRTSRKKTLVMIFHNPIITSYASAFESIAAQQEKSDVVGVSFILWGVGEKAKPGQTRRTDLACAGCISPSELVQFPTFSVIRLRRKSLFGGQRLCPPLGTQSSKLTRWCSRWLYSGHEELVHVHPQMLASPSLMRYRALWYVFLVH